jgi:hypothetical protein
MTKIQIRALLAIVESMAVQNRMMRYVHENNFYIVPLNKNFVKIKDEVLIFGATSFMCKGLAHTYLQWDGTAITKKLPVSERERLINAAMFRIINSCAMTLCESACACSTHATSASSTYKTHICEEFRLKRFQTQRLERVTYKKVEYIRFIYQNHKMTNPTLLQYEVLKTLKALSETGNFTPVQAANCLKSVLQWMIDNQRDWASRSRGRGVRSAAIREINAKLSRPARAEQAPFPLAFLRAVRM